MARDDPIFAVLGTGNVGQALAADITLKGFAVNLTELPAFAHRLAAIRAHGGIEIKGRASQGFAKPKTITGDLATAVGEADVIFVASPAYGHQAWCEALAEYLKGGRFVVFISCFGALRCHNWLRAAGVDAEVTPVETVSAMFAVRASAPGRVEVYGVKDRLDVAAIPARRTDDFLETIRRVYPQMAAAQDVFETSLNNLNPVVHVPMIVFNAGRIESGDPESWNLYREGATESVVRVMLRIDAERLAIAERLGLARRSLEAAFASFYPPLPGAASDSLARTLSTSPVHARSMRGTPDNMGTRYLTEDVPFGLAPWASLGHQWGIATPTLDATIELCRVLMEGADPAPALTAEALGIAAMGPAEARAAVA